MSANTTSCSCTDVTRREVPSLYCDIPIGKDTSDNFALSYKGVAVKSDCGHRYTTFRVEDGAVKIYDVTGLTLPGCADFIYRVPVNANQVQKGDLLLISECPLQVVYVEDIDKNSGRVRGLTATGDEVRYIPPIRLGDCVRYIRIVSVLDVCGGRSTEMSEDDIALVAALLCCKNCSSGYEYTPGIIAQNLVGAFKGKLPLLLALQQGQCLESFILTRALQGRINEPCGEVVVDAARPRPAVKNQPT